MSITLLQLMIRRARTTLVQLRRLELLQDHVLAWLVGHGAATMSDRAVAVLL